ncbi:MAG: glutamate--tRNA ligase [Phycisphaerae bacterium]|nr:glutamate--tRNA ligase [Phycisphaerae bacterium]
MTPKVSSPDSSLPAGPVTRFAPSPSGHLHVGGARTALFCWAFANGRNGTFLLRIEDTDQKRSSDAASIGFLNDLDWLGIHWNEGPAFTRPDGTALGGGAHGPYFQSERADTYNRYIEQLIRDGHAYHAFDTPEELDAKRKASLATKTPYRYDRAALQLSPAEVDAHLRAGTPAVVRCRVPAGPIVIKDEILGEATIPAGEVDDFVIRKVDGFPTYHFAVVVDDELMGVTHVLRAQEHFTNTAKHMVLQDALGFRRPTYAHLPLIFNPDGSKMSKRDKDKTLRAAVQQKGLTEPPADLGGAITAEAWKAWFGDKNKQLDFDIAAKLAAILDVTLPEINVDDFRRSGYLPSVVCNFLALNGWSPGENIEKFDLEFLKARFDLSRVQKTPAKFDRVKLLSFNCDAITSMAREEFLRLSIAHGEQFHPAFLKKLTREQFAMLAGASHERSKTLDELFRNNRWVTAADGALTWDDSKNVRKAMLEGTPPGIERLRGLQPTLTALADWSPAALEAAVKLFADANTGGNLGMAAQPLRVAVTGGTVSPPIFDTLAILGKESSLVRISRCLAHFGS